ncbi:MAG: glycosyltransferase family 4 protein [Pirellulaceae bacterium]
MPEKIALVIHSLAGGGAERVVSLLANHWVERGIDVSVITLDTTDNDAFPLHSDVRRVGLELMSNSRSLGRAVFSNYRRIRKLRRVLRAFAAPITISFTDKMNVVTLIACWRMGAGVTICERTDPRHQPMGRFWSRLRRLLYPRSRSLVVQTGPVRTWARALVPNRPIYVIPNAAPCSRGEEEGNTTASRDTYRTLALGRLSPEKGFDLLLSAFARIADRHPNWNLIICGEGAERAALESLCQQLDLQDRVELPGWVCDPDRALRDADLFVLPSRYEGFPNALLEAMAAGLACISFDCDSGPGEIIRDGEDGLLVPPEDVTGLAQAMDRLVADDALRRQLGSAARQVTQRFSMDRFFRQWDAVIGAATEQEVDELARPKN